MTVESSHPSHDELSQYLSGRLDEAGRMAVEQHVMRCESCCETLDVIDDDRLFALARCGGAQVQGRPDTLQTSHSATPVSGAAVSHDVPVDLREHPRYVVERCLGFGGMGSVYKARHRLMDRAVALKVIHPQLVDNPDAQQQFRIEVKAAARLSHQNIVTAYDAEKAGDTHFLVMEFVDGESLADHVLREGPLNAKAACEIIRQAANGLQHASEHGLVHRDIKPSNLMRVRQADGSDTIKILDFGIARMAQSAESPPTVGVAPTLPQEGFSRHDSMVLGTPQYMAPEQLDNARSADVRSDIYSLGCTLHYLLTGRPPFYGESFFDRVHRRRTSPGEELRRENPDVPEAVAELLDRMMAVDPGQRFQTPGEIMSAIDQSGIVESAGGSQDSARAERSAVRRRWSLLTAFGLVAACLAFAAVVFGPDDSVQDGDATDGMTKDSQNTNDLIEFPAPIDNPSASIHVLLLVASSGVRADEYESMLRILEDAGIAVHVSGSAQQVNVVDESRTVGTLKTTMALPLTDSSYYDVIVALGGDWWSEFGRSPQVEAKMRELMSVQLDGGQRVGAICSGQVVPGRAGLLEDVYIARPPPTVYAEDWGAMPVEDQPVVVDGLILTARDPDDTAAFATKILHQFGLAP